MDMLIALMTKGFKDSPWTNQEIGYALGKKVPVLSINIGGEPCGFPAKYQAINSTWDNLGRDIKNTIFQYFLNVPKVLDTYINLMRTCGSFNEGNSLSEYLPYLKQLTDEQVDEIIEIYDSNSQLRGSLGFNGADINNNYGEGLVYHLNRVLGRNIYKFIGSKIFKVN